MPQSPIRRTALELTNETLGRRDALDQVNEVLPPATAVETQYAPGEDLARGLRTSSDQILAGELYRRADKAELEARPNDAQRLRGEAQRIQDQAQFTAQRVGSTADVRNVGDAIDFAQGGLGQLIPSMAATAGPGIIGGIAGGLVGGPVGAYAGAALGAGVPGFKLAAGEAASSQQADPAIRALPVEERMREQTRVGLESAAAELIFPGLVGNRLAGGVKRVFGQLDKSTRPSLGRAVATETGAEMVTEGAQAISGQAALNRLNPDRDRSGDLQEIIDAVVLGGLGGGGISLGTTVPGYVAHRFAERAQRLPEDAARGAGRVAGRARNAVDRLDAELGRRLDGVPLDEVREAGRQGTALPDEGVPLGETQQPPVDGGTQPSVDDGGIDLRDAGKKYSRLSDFLDDETRRGLEAIGQDVDVEGLEADAEGGSVEKLDNYFNKSFEEVATAANLPDRNEIEGTNLAGFEVLTRLPSEGRAASFQRAHFPIDEGPEFLQDQIDKGIITDGEIKPLGDYLDSIGASTQELLLELDGQRRYINDVLEEHVKKGAKEDRTAMIARNQELLDGLPDAKKLDPTDREARATAVEALNRYGVLFADRSDNTAATDFDLQQYRNSLQTVNPDKKRLSELRKQGLSEKQARNKAIAEKKAELLRDEGVTFRRADGTKVTYLKSDMARHAQRREGREAISDATRNEDDRAWQAAAASIMARNDFVRMEPESVRGQSGANAFELEQQPGSPQGAAALERQTREQTLKQRRLSEPLTPEQRRALAPALQRLRNLRMSRIERLTDANISSEERAEEIETLEYVRDGWQSTLREARRLRNAFERSDQPWEAFIEGQRAQRAQQPGQRAGRGISDEAIKMARSAPYMNATQQLIDDLAAVAQAGRDRQNEVFRDADEAAVETESEASFVKTDERVDPATGETLTRGPGGRLDVEQNFGTGGNRLGPRFTEEQTGAGAQVQRGRGGKTSRRVSDTAAARRIERLAQEEADVRTMAERIDKTPTGAALTTASHAIALGNRPENRIAQRAMDALLDLSPERQHQMGNAARVVVMGSDVSDKRLTNALQVGATIIAPNLSGQLRSALEAAGYRQRVLPEFTSDSRVEQSVVASSWVPSAGSGAAYRVAEGDVEARIPRAEAQAEQTTPNVIEGDIWAQDGVKIVSTNLQGVHGRGLAKQAKDKGFIRQGQNVDFDSSPKNAPVITIAVKGAAPETAKIRGRAFSERTSGKNVELMQSELRKLVEHARANPDTNFFLPFIGLGFGEGDRAQILPILEATAREPNIFLVSKDAQTVKRYAGSFAPGIRRDATSRTGQSAPVPRETPQNVPSGTITPIEEVRARAQGRGTTQKTASGNVVVKNGVPAAKAYAAEDPENRVYTLRKGSAAHFGNPFTNLPINRTQGTVQRVGSVAEAVQAYRDWLTTTKYDGKFGPALDARKKWILQQLPKLKGKELVYYKELNEPSHANVLDELIQAAEGKKPSRLDAQAQGPATTDAQTLIDEVYDYLSRMIGPDIARIFVIDGAVLDDQGNPVAGFYDFMRKTIAVSIAGLDPHGTAAHEAFHAFFNQLGQMDTQRQLYNKLLKFSQAPHIQRQLKALLENDPDALAQLADPEEALAYAFQFSEALDPNGQPLLRLTPENRSLFRKLAQRLAKVLGLITREEAALEIFRALGAGELRTPLDVQNKILSLENKGMGHTLNAIYEPVRRGIEKTLLTPIDRLRNTGIDALGRIADIYHRDPRTGGGLGLIERRAQKFAQLRNQYFDILERHNVDPARMNTARTRLQNMEPHTEGSLEAELHDFLGEIYNYLENVGVSRPDGEGGWTPIQFVDNYFPRYWDPAQIARNDQEFIRLLVAEGGLTQAQAAATVAQIVNNDGMISPGDEIEFSPAMASVSERIFTFITPENAARFSQFQKQDLTEIMTRYIRDAAHRGEHTRSFGPGAQRLTRLKAQAQAQGATADELAMAEKAVQALDGRLEHDSLSPLQRNVMNGAMTLVNFAILPMALFASLVDPLGVMVRTGSVKAAANTFKSGAKQVWRDARNIQGADQKIAEWLGIIEEENMLEVVGDTYNGMYMNPQLRKLNDKFFRLIGLNGWTRGTRVGAMNASFLWLRDNADNAEALAELNLVPGDIRPDPDTIIDLNNPKVKYAVYRMVDESILRPNAAQRPIWMSDPRFMLLGHLKQFTFSFHNTIVRQVYGNWQKGREAGGGRIATLPVFLPLLAYVPFMLAADILRATVGGRLDDEDREFEEFVADAIQRSAVTGLGTFAFDMTDDFAYNGAPINTLFGPVIDQSLRLGRAVIDPDVEFADAAVKSLPGYALWRGWLQ